MAIKPNCQKRTTFHVLETLAKDIDFSTVGALDFKRSGLIRTLIQGRFWLKQYRPNVDLALRFQEGGIGVRIDF